jgi:hypothetical protein
MHYEFTAIPDAEIPRAAERVFQHGPGAGQRGKRAARTGDSPWPLGRHPCDLVRSSCALFVLGRGSAGSAG